MGNTKSKKALTPEEKREAFVASMEGEVLVRCIAWGLKDFYGIQEICPGTKGILSPYVLGQGIYKFRSQDGALVFVDKNEKEKYFSEVR